MRLWGQFQEIITKTVLHSFFTHILHHDFYLQTLKVSYFMNFKKQVRGEKKKQMRGLKGGCSLFHTVNSGLIFITPNGLSNLPGMIPEQRA